MILYAYIMFVLIEYPFINLIDLIKNNTPTLVVNDINDRKEVNDNNNFELKYVFNE